MASVQCRSWDEAEVHITALQSRLQALEKRVRTLEKQIDTLGSPWWKRVWFRVDGWPAWWLVATKRSPRPWHK